MEKLDLQGCTNLTSQSISHIFDRLLWIDKLNLLHIPNIDPVFIEDHLPIKKIKVSIANNQDFIRSWSEKSGQFVLEKPKNL